LREIKEKRKVTRQPYSRAVALNRENPTSAKNIFPRVRKKEKGRGKGESAPSNVRRRKLYSRRSRSAEKKRKEKKGGIKEKRRRNLALPSVRETQRKESKVSPRSVPLPATFEIMQLGEREGKKERVAYVHPSLRTGVQ